MSDSFTSDMGLLLPSNHLNSTHATPPQAVSRQTSPPLHHLQLPRSLPYLQSPEAKQTFLTVLEETGRRCDFKIIGYVVMPEHVHLLITEPPDKPLNIALAVLKREVSSRLPEKPFWLPRYYDFNIFTERKRLEKLRYLHRNPVVRGLVAKPEEYIWFSFRSYAFNEPSTVTITRIL
jgi:putative transposase